MDQIVFGPFCLDLKSSRLVRGHAAISLRPQALQALRLLLQRNGEYVGYEELLRGAWGGIIVSRHTVASTIGDVRRALDEYGSWIEYRPKLGYRLEIPRSDELIRTGWHLYDRRTREGFEKGLSTFQQAAQQDPSDARAFEGIARCFLMLGTYGMRRPDEMYTSFLDAHAHCVAFRGLTPALRADRARALHLFELNFEEAGRELDQAIREEPAWIPSYLFKAMLDTSLGKFEAALNALDHVRGIDRLFATFPATETFVHLFRRDFDTAVKCGRNALELYPYMHLSRSYYAQALEFAGQLDQALVEYRLATVISPDILWMRALEARCLAKAGLTKEAMGIQAELERLRATDYVDAYHMALLNEELGQRNAAFEELERAMREKSATIYVLDVDPKLDSLRQDARFVLLREEAFAGDDLTV